MTDRFDDVLQPPEVVTARLTDDGTFPNNAQVSLPAMDPIYGEGGPLVEHWEL